MEFIKVNETVNFSFLGENDDFKYKVEVVKIDNEVKSVTFNVSRKTEIGEQQAGYVMMKNGNKSMTFPVNEDTIQHITIFENFISEYEND